MGISGDKAINAAEREEECQWGTGDYILGFAVNTRKLSVRLPGPK